MKLLVCLLFFLIFNIGYSQITGNIPIFKIKTLTYTKGDSLTAKSALSGIDFKLLADFRNTSLAASEKDMYYLEFQLENEHQQKSISYVCPLTNLEDTFSLDLFIPHIKHGFTPGAQKANLHTWIINTYTHDSIDLPDFELNLTIPQRKIVWVQLDSLQLSKKGLNWFMESALSPILYAYRSSADDNCFVPSVRYAMVYADDNLIITIRYCTTTPKVASTNIYYPEPRTPAQALSNGLKTLFSPLARRQNKSIEKEGNLKDTALVIQLVNEQDVLFNSSSQYGKISGNASCVLMPELYIYSYTIKYNRWLWNSLFKLPERGIKVNIEAQLSDTLPYFSAEMMLFESAPYCDTSLLDNHFYFIFKPVYKITGKFSCFNKYLCSGTSRFLVQVGVNYKSTYFMLPLAEYSILLDEPLDFKNHKIRKDKKTVRI